MKRRDFLASSAYASLLGGTLRTKDSETTPYTPPEYQTPVFDLHKFFPQPVRIQSIELLQGKKKYFVHTRSTDGAVGIAETKNMEYYVPMLLAAVIPYFIGKDARDLEHLVDGVDARGMNYKMAGQAFWTPVSYVEHSIFDLLGRIATSLPVNSWEACSRKRSPFTFLDTSATQPPKTKWKFTFTRGSHGRESGQVQDRGSNE